MKHLITACSIFICALTSTAQSFQWANLGGGTGPDEGYGVTTDASGNIYNAGIFSSGGTFGSFNLTAGGAADMFITKTSPSGTVIWAKNFGGSGSAEAGAAELVSDNAGNLYAIGYFAGTVNFAGTTLTAASSRDGFIMKLDANGNMIWAKQTGGANTMFLIGADTDAAGNLYLTGGFTGTASFGGQPLSTNANVTLFVVKMAADGTFTWARKSSGSGSCRGQGLAVDAAGNIVLTGYVSGTVLFGASTVTSGGGLDQFIAKMDNTGTFTWATANGSPGTDIGVKIDTDASGNIYTTGYYTQTATFGSLSATTSASRDYFLLKTDPSGAGTWLRTAQGNITNEGLGLHVDASGNIHTCGFYQGSVTFGSFPFSITGFQSNDAFIARYDASGNVVFATSTTAGDIKFSWDITADASGNAYMTGYALGATFGSHVLGEYGDNDVFLAKLGRCDNPINTNTTTAGNIITATATGADYQWIDCSSGSPVAGQTAQAFIVSSPGAYAVIITSGNCSDTSACVTIATTGIATAGTAFTVFPNPAQQQISIATPVTVPNGTLRITDMSGKTLRIQPFNGGQQLIDLSGIAPGIYIVSLCSSGNESHLKLVKN